MKKMLLLLFVLGVCSSFRWDALVELPPGGELIEGHQILHFKSRDKPYWDNEDARNFVQKYLKKAMPLESDADVLKLGSDSVKLKGLYIELGVCTGKTVNFIAGLNSQQKVYGFDSFQGLPEDWIRSDKTFPAGTFAFKDPNMLPPVLHNVELVKGLFKDSLPSFDQIIDPQEPIAFLHVDCDIYSSTATALKVLGHRIGPGTIIVFDEFYNYPGSENHEFKAFQEFLNSSGLKARYLGYNVNHEQVAVEIEEKN